MRVRPFPLLLGSFCLLLVAALPAQDPVDEADAGASGAAQEAAGGAAPAAPPEGHSHYGHAFNEGPRQAAYLMSDWDKISFPVTTEKEQAQRFVDQGVGQLHGFWYFEAERSFRQAAALDPECAMSYWGMAMANVENQDRAAGFAREAYERREHVTAREQLYIDALAKYYAVDWALEVERPIDSREPAEREKRGKQLVEDWEEILFDFPDDHEAKAFLVNFLWMKQGEGLSRASRQAYQALLDQVFAANPMHPAHHYRIHLWDTKEHAHRVLDSAAKIGPSYPSVAHMWHMGGHIYARLGRHSDAAWQQEASARVDHAHMMRDWVLPDQIHNFAHNNEWLSRSLRDCGRVRESVDVAKNMIEMPRHPKWNTLEKFGTSASFGRMRLVETLERTEQWEELLALAETPYWEPREDLSDRASRASLLGKAHAYLGDLDGLATQIDALDAVLTDAKLERMVAAEEAEEEAIEEDKGRGEVLDAMRDALGKHARTIENVRKKRDALVALGVLLDGGDVEDSLQELEDAGLAKLELARLALEHADGERAERLTSEFVEDADGVAVVHATHTYVLESLGKREAATAAFEELRSFSSRFDLDLRPFQRLAPLAAELGYAADWRIEEIVPDDVAARIDLETLGPFRWSPVAAPEWSLPDGFGDRLSLDDFTGKPTVVILFLGFGCVHCVEQLLAFKPKAAEFESAGISIVAIGTDSLEELAESQADDDPEDRYPFPILADPELRVFRDYRCHDDFEDMALHGTFLLDGSGRVRWQDISYEPFTDADFLLTEAQRLLALPLPQSGGGAAAGTPGR